MAGERERTEKERNNVWIRDRSRVWIRDEWNFTARAFEAGIGSRCGWRDGEAGFCSVGKRIVDGRCCRQGFSGEVSLGMRNRRAPGGREQHEQRFLDDGAPAAKHIQRAVRRRLRSLSPVCPGYRYAG